VREVGSIERANPYEADVAQFRVEKLCPDLRVVTLPGKALVRPSVATMHSISLIDSLAYNSE